jgi:cytidylate kinase
MPETPAFLHVAIDGPSASGKSTVARSVAERIGAIYVDSGAWYRGMTWAVLQHGAKVRQAGEVLDVMRRTRWVTEVRAGAVVYSIDGLEPGDALRSEPVRESVSDVAAIPDVRAFIVERLRETARYGDLVMEGRDIGTVVFPDTPYKFYLDADPEERARRRLKEIVSLEGLGDVETVRQSLQRRDSKDRTRATAPLQVAPEARILDSTALTVAEVVAIIVTALPRRGDRS